MTMELIDFRLLLLQAVICGKFRIMLKLVVINFMVTLDT